MLVQVVLSALYHTGLVLTLACDTITVELVLSVDDPSFNTPVQSLTDPVGAVPGNVAEVQFAPKSTLLRTSADALATSRNAPESPKPSESTTVIAPVVLFILVTVSVKSFAGVAPPKLVPAITIVSPRA